MAMEGMDRGLGWGDNRGTGRDGSLSTISLPSIRLTMLEDISRWKLNGCWDDKPARRLRLFLLALPIVSIISHTSPLSQPPQSFLWSRSDQSLFAAAACDTHSYCARETGWSMKISARRSDLQRGRELIFFVSGDLRRN
jgi:hypothetical protein